MAEQRIIVTKPFSIIRARFFGASKLLQHCTQRGIGAETHQKSPTRTAAKTTRRYNSRYFSDFRNICSKEFMTTSVFVLSACFGGPWRRFARSAKDLLLGQPSPPGVQTPQSLCSLCGNNPNKFCKCFPNLLRFPLCGLLRKIFRNFGIHQRRVKEKPHKL